MRNKTGRYRALTAEFIAHLTGRGHWPNGTRFRDYMSEHHGGASGGTLTDLKAGRALPEKASLGLITMLRKSQHVVPGARGALSEFAAKHGLTDPEEATPEQLLEVVAGPVQSTPTSSDEAADYLLSGVRAISELLELPKRKVNELSRPCAPEEIEDAVRWIHVLIAHHTTRRNAWESITHDSAREQAERHMGISAEQYAAFLRHVRAEWPLAVRMGEGRKHPVGLTVVLPLKPEAYTAVRCGKRASFHCGPDDLQVPSRHLLIEAVAERMGVACVDQANPTLPLLASLLVQLSHLSAFNTLDRGTEMCLLSFAGTPKSKARLARQGFKPTGFTMPSADVEIMERRFKVGGMRPLEFLTSMALLAMAQWIPPD